MTSLSSVGLGLSVVFTCLLLALVAEIYYLLWWKRRIIRREIEDGYNNQTRDFLHKFFRKKPSLQAINPTTIHNHQNPDFQFHTQDNNKEDYLGKPFDEENGGIETELITGPPRFLFTIKEETKEDLESEDGRQTREGRICLDELMKRLETPPFLTPLSSPAFVTPPITPMGSCHSSQSGYNPFYESSNDAEFNKIVKASPPPKFKFLRDAEEKLQRKIMLMEEAKRKEQLSSNVVNKDNNNDEVNLQEGSFIRIIVAKSKEKEGDGKANHHYHSPHCQSFCSSSSSSQVLPLASSPNTKVKSSIAK